MKKIDTKVLEIIKAQSPDYLIQPTATAFIVEGLVPGEVEASLFRLWKKALVDHVITTEVDVDEEGNEFEVLGEDGKPKIVNQGFKIGGTDG